MRISIGQSEDIPLPLALASILSVAPSSTNESEQIEECDDDYIFKNNWQNPFFRSQSCPGDFYTADVPEYEESEHDEHDEELDEEPEVFEMQMGRARIVHPDPRDGPHQVVLVVPAHRVKLVQPAKKTHITSAEVGPVLVQPAKKTHITSAQVQPVRARNTEFRMSTTPEKTVKELSKLFEE
ncbi:MAG: uncharacterized protein KVP18_000980 [Porospora cf. gigantea A]|uniref:uncharacterized protein n=1 Tax=Porospora cf. gigantea A TaxID=2853593 RepID=UPI00355A1442|nr:MAG: hypothetical protein KVP18_000980 [Porospora cf. gigantea A]